MKFHNVNNSNNKAVESEFLPIEQNNKPVKNTEQNIFDRYIEDSEKTLIDTNKDGTISFDELKNYVNSSNAKDDTLFDIAVLMGYEKENRLPFSKDSLFKYNISNSLEFLKKADSNNDSNISFEEIKNSQTLSSGEKEKLYNMLGIVDGNINNKQGRYGSCWALAAGYGISKVAPELFKQVVKTDESGNAVVTLYGVSEKPFECTINKESIRRQIQRRAQIVNNNTLNPYDNDKLDTRRYSSSDPDAIAIEIAFAEYDRYINNKKSEYLKHLKEYVKSSTPNIIQKPDISTLSVNMSQEEWDNVMNYYRNSDSPDREKYLFYGSIDYLNEETINNMKQYITNSTPQIIEKPELDSINGNVFNIANYIKNSHSSTVKKPEIKTIDNRIGSIKEGGSPGRAIKAMVGGEYQEINNYKYDEEGNIVALTKDEKKEIKKELECINSNNDNKRVYTVSFKKDDSTVIDRHAYFISKIDGKKVYLVDQHNTNKIIVYSMKKLLDNFDILNVNILPDTL